MDKFNSPTIAVPSPAPWWALRRLGHAIQGLVPTVLLALGLQVFVAQATVVHGASMEPSLYTEQRLLLDKVSYRMHAPRRNDIVVINSPQGKLYLIKRVVGLPGDTVEIKHGRIFINGTLLDEPYVHNLSGETLPPVVIPPLSYYVLGDNRRNSNDSRVFGPIRRDDIIGRAWLRYWPLPQIARF